jgi:hypothetical protein
MRLRHIVIDIPEFKPNLTFGRGCGLETLRLYTVLNVVLTRRAAARQREHND